MPIDARDPNALPSWLTGDPFADETDDVADPSDTRAPGPPPESLPESPPASVRTPEPMHDPEVGLLVPVPIEMDDLDLEDPEDTDDPADVAYTAGEWSAYEGQAPPPELVEDEIDTSPVSPDEMTGIWLTTQYGTESPVWLDGEPMEPEDLNIAPELIDRLRDWADMWNTQWHPDSGWQPRARITDYEALGEWLARRVKDASGAVRVTVQPGHLGRSGIHEIDAPEVREPMVVRLMNDYGRAVPVWTAGDGSFVTEFGVGSFSSEVNARLEAWAQEFEAFMDPQNGWQAADLAQGHADEGHDLARAMQEELGPDYRVELELWELEGRPPAV